MDKTIKGKDLIERKIIDQSRNYGIDLLRIVCMVMIVVLHLLGIGGIIDSTKMFSLKYEAGCFLQIITFCAVNCYGLISGFVGYGRKYKISSIIVLWFEVAFYSILISLAFKIFAPSSISIIELITSFFPVLFFRYWYFTSYFCMFLFIPFFNVIINKLDFKKFSTFIILLVGVFSFLPTLFLTKVFSGDIFVLNYGYSPLWLSIEKAPFPF